MPAPPATTEQECTSPEPTGKLPTPPKCFTREQAERFQNLVVDLLAARVPLERVDTQAIAMVVRCISAIEGAEQIANDGDATHEQKLQAYRIMSAFSKDQKDWLQLICATPTARIRAIGKPAPERKTGPLAAILAARQGRKA